MANDTLQGWSRTTWSNGAFGAEGTVVVSGVQASASCRSSGSIWRVKRSNDWHSGDWAGWSGIQLPERPCGARRSDLLPVRLELLLQASPSPFPLLASVPTQTLSLAGAVVSGLKVHGASRQAELVRFRLALGTL
jgi:hypothetical protein